MKKIRQIFKILIIIVFFISVYYNQEIIIENTKIVLSKSLNFLFYDINLKLGVNETLDKDILIEFCPNIKCYNVYANAFSNAKSKIKCSFFEFDEEKLSKVLLKKSDEKIDISLIIDDKYLNEKPLINLHNSSIKIYSDINRNTKYNNYMHNKFCVIDDKILITGSTNPTFRGFYKNNNNVIKINSKYLVKNYENEFNQMSNNIFGTNKKSVLEYNNINLSYENQSYLISSYFCPQDNCEEEILEILNNAKSEILFASFVLTSDEIENLLIKKSKNISVIGLIEKTKRNSKGAKIKELNKYFKIHLDKNKNNMHNKFFIVDEKYVITGSMNPSASGDKYNDENILIIENEKIAKRYKNEFKKMIK